MLGLELRFEDGTTQAREFAFPIEIGRSPQCSLRIRTWRVAKLHARIDLRESGVFLDDFGSLGGTLVNGRRVAQYGPLHAGDQILIGPCLILLTQLPRADPCNGSTRTIGGEPPCEDAYPCKSGRNDENGKNDGNGISAQNSQNGAPPAGAAALHTATVAVPENTGAPQLPAPDPHTSIHALFHF